MHAHNTQRKKKNTHNRKRTKESEHKEGSSNKLLAVLAAKRGGAAAVNFRERERESAKRRIHPPEGRALLYSREQLTPIHPLHKCRALHRKGGETNTKKKKTHTPHIHTQGSIRRQEEKEVWVAGIGTPWTEKKFCGARKNVFKLCDSIARPAVATEAHSWCQSSFLIKKKRSGSPPAIILAIAACLVAYIPSVVVLLS